MKLFGCLIGLAYVGILLNEAIDEALKMTRRGEVWETATMDLQVWPTRWFLPVGCALMLLWLFLHAVDSVARPQGPVPMDAPASPTSLAATPLRLLLALRRTESLLVVTARVMAHLQPMMECVHFILKNQ